MKVFRLTGVANQNMVFLPKDEGDLYRGRFAGATNVGELLYQDPPELILRSAETNQQKYKGKALRVPDIGHFTPGSVIVNERASQCIGDYLRRFGDLNEIQVEGETWYNYVISNVLSGVVDEERSEKSRSGIIKKVVFRADRLPADSQIFKVPETQRINIYFNAGSGDSLASLIEEHELEAGDISEIWDSETD